MEVRIKCVECICTNTCHLKPSSAGTQSVPQSSSAAMEQTLTEVEIRRTDGSLHIYIYTPYGMATRSHNDIVGRSRFYAEDLIA